MKLSMSWNLLTISLAITGTAHGHFNQQLTARDFLHDRDNRDNNHFGRWRSLNEEGYQITPLSQARLSRKALAKAYTSSFNSWHTREPSGGKIRFDDKYGRKDANIEFASDNLSPPRLRQTNNQHRASGLYPRSSSDTSGSEIPRNRLLKDAIILPPHPPREHRKHHRRLDLTRLSSFASGESDDIQSQWKPPSQTIRRRDLDKRTNSEKPLSRSGSAPELHKQRSPRVLNSAADKTNPRGTPGVPTLPVLNKYPGTKWPGAAKKIPNGHSIQPVVQGSSSPPVSPIHQEKGPVPVNGKLNNPPRLENGAISGHSANGLTVKTSVTPKSVKPPVSRTNPAQVVPEIQPDSSIGRNNHQRSGSFGRQSSHGSLPPRIPSDGSRGSGSLSRPQLPVSYPASVSGGSPDSSYMPTPFGSIQGIGSLRASMDTLPGSPRSSKGSSPSGSPRATQPPTIPEHPKSNPHSPASSPRQPPGTWSKSTSLSGVDMSGSSSPSGGQTGTSSSNPYTGTGTPSSPSSTNLGSSDQLFRPQKSKSFTNVSPRKIDLSTQSAPPSRPLPPLERPLTRVNRVAAKVGSPFLWTYNNPAKAARIGASMTANAASGGAAVAAAYHNVPGALTLAVCSATLKFAIDCYDAQDKVKSWHKQEGIGPHQDIEATKKIVSALKTVPSKLVPEKLSQTLKKIVSKENLKQDDEPAVLREEWPIDKLGVRR